MLDVYKKGSYKLKEIDTMITLKKKKHMAENRTGKGRQG